MQDWVLPVSELCVGIASDFGSTFSGRGKSWVNHPSSRQWWVSYTNPYGDRLSWWCRRFPSGPTLVWIRWSVASPLKLPILSNCSGKACCKSCTDCIGGRSVFSLTGPRISLMVTMSSFLHVGRPTMIGPFTSTTNQVCVSHNESLYWHEMAMVPRQGSGVLLYAVSCAWVGDSTSFQWLP